MSIVHIHLLLNHFPIVGAVLGVLLLSVALMRRSDELGKAALGLFVFIGAISVAVFFTGEPAEEAVEHLPGFSKSITERHEEAALLATIVMGAFAGLALLALGAFRKRVMPRWAASLALVAALGVTGFMGFAANLGGQVRHTEIRSTAAPSRETGEMEPGRSSVTPAGVAIPVHPQ